MAGLCSALITWTALGTLVMDLVMGLMKAVGFSNRRSGVTNTGECVVDDVADFVCLAADAVAAANRNIGMFSIPSSSKSSLETTLFLSPDPMGHSDTKGESHWSSLRFRAVDDLVADSFRSTMWTAGLDGS